jgi:transglutaminase-like putative cysteine protease
MTRIRWAGLGLLLAGLLTWGGFEYRAAQRTWYAVEMGGRVVGYASEGSSAQRGDGTLDEDVDAFVKLSALGQSFDLRATERRRVDAQTGRLIFSEAELVTGPSRVGVTAVVEPHAVRYSTRPDGRTARIPLEPQVIVGDRPLRVRVARELRQRPEGEVTLKVFDVTRGRIQERSFRRVGAEPVEVAGASRHALIVDQYNHSTGGTDRLWLDRDDGMLLQSVASDGTTLRLADRWVRWHLGRASMDDTLLYPVETVIEDVRALASMRLRAAIRTTGEIVTADSLNVPGQRFTGSVDANRIEGVFEIAWDRYQGEGAPAFPPPAAAGEGFEPYLRPGFLIESEDAELVRLAQRLTEGADDAWEAARRLSRWVAEEIRYAIPGGSAQQTFDRRAGDCGGHARLLVALARAAGIPARLATGALYFEDGGGHFGQHAWVELHMGAAGWVPVDPTVREIDFVDAGHLRLGSLTSFQPLEMEVLDYALRPGAGSGRVRRPRVTDTGRNE